MVCRRVLSLARFLAHLLWLIGHLFVVVADVKEVCAKLWYVEPYLLRVLVRIAVQLFYHNVEVFAGVKG